MIFTVLSELTSEYNTMTEKNLMIRQLEHECDNFTHRLLLLLLTFVTPIDRGNIPKLSGSINEVLDCVDVTSDR
jgi:Phosphate transport regulator (distant homolog of PhoU)